MLSFTFLDSDERARITTSKLPTQKYKPKQDDIQYSSSNPTRSGGSVRNNPTNETSKDSAFTDEDDDLFSAIKMEEVKEELPEGDDDIFQSIETFDTPIEQSVELGPR